MDALAFVKDAVHDNLAFAVRKRGGIAQVRRKSPSKPTHPRIELKLRLTDDRIATYGFELAALRNADYRIGWERCEIRDASETRVIAGFSTRGENLEIEKWTPGSAAPPVSPDRLYLVSASGLPEFRSVYDALSRMVFHNLNPEVMKSPQRPEPGPLLLRDGSNLASVVKQLRSADGEPLNRVYQYLQAIGIPIERIEHKQAGSLETIEVLQKRGNEGRPGTFDAISLSDGTIRAMGLLVSLMSARANSTSGPLLIGVEEPETALHPAAAAVMMDALLEGAETSQLIITCHSPELLQHQDVRASMIRPVVLEDGVTRIGVLDKKKQGLLEQHLTTADELLRIDQLQPDPEDLERQLQRAGTLFQELE